MSNQNKPIEALNAEIERCLTKLNALKTAKANLSEAEGSDDECENNTNAQNHHRLKTMRKTTVLHDRDELQSSYKPKINEPSTLYPRKSIEALRLPHSKLPRV